MNAAITTAWIIVLMAAVGVVIWTLMLDKPKKIETKELDDLLWTPYNSTKWENQKYCECCLSSLEIGYGYCSSCSEPLPEDRAIRRAHRKIWRGYGWAHQYRYRDGRMELTKEPL